MVTDQLDHVIGVDTHSGEHALCLLEAATQRVLAETTVSADRRGYRATLRLAIRFAPGRRLWAIEGTGSYGKGLARFLQERGERVVEVARPLREGVGNEASQIGSTLSALLARRLQDAPKEPHAKARRCSRCWLPVRVPSPPAPPPATSCAPNL